MSTLDIVGFMNAHSVQTSVADLLGRNARLNDTLTRVTLGCLTLCDFCPEDCEYTIEAECGKITRCSIDLSCVPEEDDDDCCSYKKKSCCPKRKRRCITINLNTCKPACRGRGNCCDDDDNVVDPCENEKIVLTYCCKDSCDCDRDECPVHIYLTNDHCPVREDEHGNCVPEYYKIGRGQIKYLLVVNGRITKIVN
jgi:hypothetical protein